MKTFGERAYYLRRKNRLTQIELAKKIGSSKTTIQNYESNTLPKGEYAIKLAKVFKCSIDWLLTGEGPIYRDTDLESYFQSTKAKNNNEPMDIPTDQSTTTELITKAIEIIESKTVYGSVLSVNIQAFHKTAALERKFHELKASMSKMEGRITDLETENSKLQEQVKNSKEKTISQTSRHNKKRRINAEVTRR